MVSVFTFHIFEQLITIIAFLYKQFLALWPGWGHASENPKVSNSLKERGIQVLSYTLIASLNIVLNRIFLENPF